MNFHPTPLQGGYLIELEKIHDERGYFARSWAMDEFSARGLETSLSQCNKPLPTTGYRPRVRVPVVLASKLRGVEDADRRDCQPE